MKHYVSLLLAVWGTGCCGLVAAKYKEIVHSDNGMPWRGTYGDLDFCLNNPEHTTYAYALDFKYDDLNDLDNIGGNGVKLYCRDFEGITRSHVSSLEGKRGKWQGIHSCPPYQYFNAFRLRVFPEQGTFGDDFAVDNIQFSCSDGTVVDGMDGVLPASRMFKKEKEAEAEAEKNVTREWLEVNGRKMEVIRHRSNTRTRLHGDWGTWSFCSPDYYVSGIRTVVEEGHIGDDAGLTDVTVYCFEPTSPPPTPPTM